VGSQPVGESDIWSNVLDIERSGAGKDASKKAREFSSGND
jgi:hypothetical protein